MWIECEDDTHFINPRFVEGLYIDELSKDYTQPFVVTARMPTGEWPIKAYVDIESAKKHLHKLMDDFGPYGES